MPGASLLPHLAAQCLHELSLRLPPGTPLGRPVASLRRRLVEHADPVVTWRYMGFRICLPLSHSLPLIHRRLPGYGMNLFRLSKALAAERPGMSVVDVGANVGDSVAVFRAAGLRQVLCIEPEPRFAALLVQNQGSLGGPLEIEKVLLAGPGAPRTGRLRSRAGTARIEGSGDPIRAETLDRALARHSGIRQALALIKVDTDGYDAAVLRGAAKTLAARKPALFFEYDPDLLAAAGEDGLSLFTYLRELGYLQGLAWDNEGALLGRIELTRHAALKKLRARFAGGAGLRYADLALFHRADSRSAAHFFAQELSR